MSSELNFPSKLSPTDNLELIHKYAGKLLLENEISPNDLLHKHQFSTIPSIKKNSFYKACQRCGNQKQSLFGMIPCSSCNETHLYCRNCIVMGRVLECKPLYHWAGKDPEWPKLESPLTWEGSLTEGQLLASNRVVQAVQQVENELLVWAVCGAGKTEMLFNGIAAALKLGKRICIATPRADVVRELKPRMQAAFSNVPVQALYGGSDDKEGTSQLIIATTHQLLRFYKAFDVVVIDEVDAFPYHNDATLPFAVNRSKKDIHTTIYLTATPRKNLRFRIATKQLPHIFVPVRYHGHPLPVPVLEISYSLSKALKQNTVPKGFIYWMKKRKNPKRQILIFVATIKRAEELAKNLPSILDKQGIIIESEAIISVNSEDEDRIEKINQFRNREIRILITTTILERGVTFPSVDVVVLDAGHSVFDEAALVQIAGRAGRSADDPTGEVIFIHDGKTEAMVKAVRSIKKMNERGGFTE